MLSATPRRSSQGIQMEISHGATEGRLLTRQDKQGGHATHTQMVTVGPVSHPIRCYPITNKVACSPPPPSFSPPSSHLHPSLHSGRRENRRCRDCIIASITVIIYTSILSFSLLFACYCNQSTLGLAIQLRHAKRSRQAGRHLFWK